MADDVPASRRGAPEHLWQGADSAPGRSARRHSRRRSRLIGLAALMLALLSFLVVGILYLRMRPPDVYLLTISVSDYDSRRFPVCAFARQDEDLLWQRFPQRDRKITKDLVLAREALDALKDKNDEHVVIYLAALALVRDEQVQVLLADARIDDPVTWWDLRDIVKAVDACPAKHKLLILDLARPMVDPHLGVLTDRVAAAMESHFTRNPPAFHVLCSCAAGQHSLTSEVLQSSVFAYCLNEGLQGKADRRGRRSVSVRDLAQYVEERVDRWAQANRGLRQQPRWFGKEVADFFLMRVPSEVAEPEPIKLEPYPDSLKKGWEERDRAVNEGAAQRAPRVLRRLDAALLRLENRWRGGALAKKEAAALDPEMQALLGSFGVALDVPHVPPRSLPLAGVKEDADLAAEVSRMLLANIKAGMDAKEQAKVASELAKRLKPADPKTGDLGVGIGAILDALGRMEQVAPAHVAVANAAVGMLLDTKKIRPAYAEVLYLHRLARYTKERDPAPPPKYVLALLQTARAHETLIAALDQAPEFLPWAVSSMKEADAKRRSAERRLFWDLRSTWEAARIDLLAAKESDEQSRKAVEALRVGRAELDRAFARLPGLMQFLCDWPEEDAEHESIWHQAAEEAVRLQAIFAQPPGVGSASTASAFASEAPARTLRTHLDDLERLFEKRISRAEKDDKPHGQQPLLVLLRNPLLGAGRKLELFDKQRKGALKLNEQTDSADLSVIHLTPQRQAGAARGRMSLALLRLAGMEPDAKTAALAAKNALAASDLAALEIALRGLWGKKMFERWRSAAADAAGDRLNRLLPPWPPDPESNAIQRDLTYRLQHAQEEAFRLWLRDAYRAEAAFWEAQMTSPDGRGLVQEQETRDFYDRAAQNVRP